jgi:Zn-dependent protease with chaperone function
VTLLALAAVAAAIGIVVAPHLLPLQRTAPSTAAAAWLGALALRAIVVASIALWSLTVLPGSDAFHWLDRVVIHPLAHVVVLLPICIVAGSLVLFSMRVVWGSVVLGRAIRRQTLGDGPFGSLVVADGSLTVAVPIVGRARPIVSHGALTAFDAGELSATIAHEVGHLRRRHRPLRTFGAALAAIAFPLPGTAAAHAGLRLSLERDADEFAVRQTGEPFSLASAICKVAGSQRGAQASIGLAEPVATELRLEQLLAGGRSRAGRAGERAAGLLAAATGLTCACMAAVTLTAIAPPGALARGVELAFECAG